MSLDGTYDHENIFAKILRGEVPSARVFEDDHVYAFMDAFPQGKGHTLVIPNEQLHAHLVLERFDILRQRRLGDVQSLRRSREAPFLRDGDEIANAAQIHV